MYIEKELTQLDTLTKYHQIISDGLNNVFYYCELASYETLEDMTNYYYKDSLLNYQIPNEQLDFTKPLEEQVYAWIINNDERLTDGEIKQIPY